MSAPADLPFDLDSLPPAVREAFAAMQAKVAGLEAHTERQDYLIAELRHALYGKRSEQLPPDARQRMRRLRPIDFARFRWVTRLREGHRLQMEVLHGGWWGWVCRAV